MSSLALLLQQHCEVYAGTSRNREKAESDMVNMSHCETNNNVMLALIALRVFNMLPSLVTYTRTINNVRFERCQET